MQADRFILIGIIAAGLLRLAPALPQKAISLSYSEAQPILTTLEEGLPDELKGKKAGEQADTWTRWLSHYAANIKARLIKGDEDSLVNFLMYGTSFTKQRRLSPDDFKSAGEQARADNAAGAKPEKIIKRRIEDLVQALTLPGSNERLQYLRGMLEEKGLNISTQTGRTAAK